MTRKPTKYFIIRRSASESESSSKDSGTSSYNYGRTSTPTVQYDGPPKLATGSDYSRESGAKLNIQKILNKDRIIRTKRGPFEIVESSAWGSILVPVEDPDAYDVTTQDIESARLIENFPKIPAELWARWADLVFHCCFNKDENKEVKVTEKNLPVKSISSSDDEAPAQFIWIGGVKKEWNHAQGVYQICEDQSGAPPEPETETSPPPPPSNNSNVSNKYEALKFTKISGKINKYGYQKSPNGSSSWQFIEIVNFDSSPSAVPPALKGEQKASRGFYSEGGEFDGYYGRGSYPSGGYSSPELEVSCLLIRKLDDLSQWRILIPNQSVTRGSVNAVFDRCCDIVTGEEITQFPPPGWAHAGSSHSHNTMSAFFSGTDDANELGVPGLHIVLGSLVKYDKSYKAKASLVLRQNRRIIDINSVVDVTPQDVKFHPNCLNYISHGSTPPASSTSPPTNNTTGGDDPKSEDSKSLQTKTVGPVAVGSGLAEHKRTKLDDIIDKHSTTSVKDEDIAASLPSQDEEDVNSLGGNGLQDPPTERLDLVDGDITDEKAIGWFGAGI